MVATSTLNYDIACPCGGHVRGQRLSRQQVVPCPACGELRFVLPSSPLPELPASIVTAPTSKRLPAFAIASVAVSGLVVIVVVGIILLRPWWRFGQPAEPPASEERLKELTAEGNSALADGAYLRAARQFEAALAVGDKLGGRPAADRRRLAQLHRQAALLGDLLAESPAEIVRQAVGLPEAEWQEVFRRRYAGAALVLDDTISRGADGRYQMGFRIVTHAGEAHLDLAPLRILRDLPMAQPQRFLLGLRLAALRRDAAGWAFTADPDSGVLLTDPEVFAGLSLAPDAEIHEVLKRQRAWVEPP